MTDYTISATPTQDLALSLIVQSANKDLAAQDPPGVAWTNATYLAARADDVLTSWAIGQQDAILGQGVAAWPDLAQESRDSVVNALGYPELAGQPADAQQKYLVRLAAPAFRALNPDQQYEVLHTLGVV